MRRRTLGYFTIAASMGCTDHGSLWWYPIQLYLRCEPADFQVLNRTDVVMASHGHTGLERVIVGSVADGLIHRLHCPIIVIPAHAARLIEQPTITVRSKDLVGSPS